MSMKMGMKFGKMKNLGVCALLALVTLGSLSAHAFQDDGFRFDAERWGCFDHRGFGQKAGLNAGWIDFDWKSLECSGLAGTRSIRGMNLTDFIGMGADLSGMDLRGVLWLRADLRAAHLSNAELGDGTGEWGSRAFFWNAKLQRANLEFVKARDVEFIDANLEGANLRGADLAGADFTRARLRGADLRGATLTGAKFDGADLRGVRYGDNDFR